MEFIKSKYENQQTEKTFDLSNDLTRPPIFSQPLPDLRRAINSLQFICQGSPGFEDVSSPSSPVIEGQKPVSERVDLQLDDPAFWDWPQCISFGPSTTFVERSKFEKQGFEPKVLNKLWQLSDALSMIDSELRRRPLASLQVSSTWNIRIKEVHFKRTLYHTVDEQYIDRAVF